MSHKVQQVTKDQNIGNIKENFVKPCYMELKKEITTQRSKKHDTKFVFWKNGNRKS